jgi:hypothetical protein
VARIRAVAEAGSPMAALAMANAQLLPWRHWLMTQQQQQQAQQAEAQQQQAEAAIPESFPSRWTREDALACLDAIATALAAASSSASASAAASSASASASASAVENNNNTEL